MTRNTLLTLVALFSLISVGHAQDEGPNSSVGIGFHLTQQHRDFGLGLNITSPFFAYEKVAVRVKGNLLWNEHPDADGQSTWSHYGNVSIGVVGVAGVIANTVRLYGEGGVLLLFPNADFSSADSEFGGYGLFGFEFFYHPSMNYYIEIGGVGSGARADLVPGNPIYSNGLLINVGFRYVF